MPSISTSIRRWSTTTRRFRRPRRTGGHAAGCGDVRRALPDWHSIYTLATRDSEGISVIHDRNPMYVRLSDGALRNGYTIRIVNKQLKYRDFIVSVDGLPSTLVDFVGLPPRADGRQLISVGPDQSKEVRVVVTDYSATPPASSTSILFKLIDIDSGENAEMRDHFFGP